MKKETLIAIILGIAAGIGIAFFLVRQSGTTPKNNDVILDEITPTISLNTSETEPLLIQSPDTEFVTDESSIEIKASAPEGSLIVIQTLLEEIVFENTSKNFTETIDLVPGENIVKVTAYNNKNIDTRSLMIYSIDSSLSSTESDDSSESTENDESNTDEKDTEENKIKALKDKIEKKVDELSKESKNIAVGLVKTIDDESLTVESNSDETFTVSLDSTITKVFEVNLDEQEEIEFEDIKEGDYIIVSGPSIEDQISANVIYVQTTYVVTPGQITNTDSGNFAIDVISSDKDEYTIDIEDDTSQRLLDIDELKSVKSGFSKIKAGDSIHVVIVKSSDDTYSAIRTFVIPQEYFTEEGSEDTTDTEE